ncbi:uncharacterized protein LOC126377866 isoform X2 [Pectinophora gossypiella]|uniref:uncharacterized protein LOC126377866 isoform X2 n=1 Tax=Pectinophora gossypiella TaxID=13191 RepID=UPI00214ECD00|nr:uncharacterized protein LOC126377866 isoform X2 [Pectinophora gossypiella]
MGKCAVKSCKNRSSEQKKKDGISYFYFPNNPIQREKWRKIIATERGEEFFKPNKRSQVCSDHFEATELYYSDKGRRMKKNTAVPQLKTSRRTELRGKFIKMPCCAIKTCKARSQTSTITQGGISYHRFPKEPYIKEAWINVTGRENWMPTKSSTICSKHFKDNDFIIKKSGNRYLKPGAIPSEKVIYSHSFTKPTSTRRRSKRISQKRTSNEATSLTDCKSKHKKIQICCEQPTSCSGSSGPNVVDESIEDQSDAELNSDDDLSDDEALDTSVSWPRQAPAASTTAGGSKDPCDDERCDSCRGGLSGIRLICVQCSYSHCAACETSGRHRHHYMLRVPANGQKGVVQKIVKMIQMELAGVASYQKPDLPPTEEQLIIKTEIKTEPEPDPLTEDASPEQLRPNILEQAMLEIDIKEEFNSDEVVDPPSPQSAPPLLAQETISANTVGVNLPITYLPAHGASVASKRRASPTQPSAPKMTCIAAPGSGGGVTVKSEPLAADETLQTHIVAGDSGEQQERTERNNTGRAPKKKQKQ